MTFLLSTDNFTIKFLEDLVFYSMNRIHLMNKLNIIQNYSECDFNICLPRKCVYTIR